MPASQLMKGLVGRKMMPPIPTIHKNVVNPKKITAFLFVEDATEHFEAYDEGQANHSIHAMWNQSAGEKGVTYSLALYLKILTPQDTNRLVEIKTGTGLWDNIVKNAKIEKVTIFVPWPEYPKDKP